MNKQTDKILFMDPVMKEVLWGGTRLRDEFHYDIPSNHTGECWAVSAHQNGDCKITKGLYKGEYLSKLWVNHRELFGNLEGDCFPLLVKIIDAKQDLSIQVHPNDAYAYEHEAGALGKTECWYILDCKDDASIVIGHHAKDKSMVGHMIRNNQWDQFIRTIPIHKGDFFQINPGTVHAIKGGTLLLETQQNSDITYRVYDYDRVSDGKKRPLHVEQSIDVIEAPFDEVATTSEQEIVQYENIEKETLIRCTYYTVEKLIIHGLVSCIQDKPFLICSVIDGEGYIDEEYIKKGMHFIIPSNYGTYQWHGEMTLICSYI